MPEEAESRFCCLPGEDMGNVRMALAGGWRIVGGCQDRLTLSIDAVCATRHSWFGWFWEDIEKHEAAGVLKHRDAVASV